MHAFFRRFARPLALAASVLGSAGALAQSPDHWPSKPIRIVMPAPAGTSVDAVARLIFGKVGASLGQPFIIDNKPGADGIIAATAGAKSASDGYNFFLSNAGVFTINPSYRSELPYNPDRDFMPVSQLTTAVLVVAARPGLEANNMQELMALAKAHPGKLNYAASTGRSGIAFLSMELLKQRTQTNMTWIAYKDDSQALTDLMGNRLDIFVDALATSLPNEKAGKLKILAVTGSRAARQIPQVKTIVDSGFPGVSGDAWIGLFAPAGTPAEIRRRMEQEVVKAIRDPQVSERLYELGFDPVGSTAAELGEIVRRDREKWGRLITDLGLKP